MLKIENHGSVVLILPEPSDAQELHAWVSERADPDAQFFGPALVVEARYVADIAAALAAEGFEITEG